MVFFDVSKAFDKVWHKGLSFKLHHAGVQCGLLTKWFTNYLSSRYQRVVLNGSYSDLYIFKRGCPSGNYTRPIIIFSLY